MKTHRTLAAAWVVAALCATDLHAQAPYSVQEVLGYSFLLIGIVDDTGWLILNADDENVVRLAEHTGAQVLTYGLETKADLTAGNVRSVGSGQVYELTFRGDVIGEFSIPILKT